MLRKILIVDDNAIDRAMLASCLEEKYQVLRAEGQRQAEDMIGQEYGELAAILVSIPTPSAEDMRLLGAIRENPAWRSLPVIAITNVQDHETTRKAALLGVEGFATKPCDPTAVLTALSNVIELREVAEEIHALRTDRMECMERRSSQDWATAKAGDARCVEIMLPIALSTVMAASADYAFVKDRNFRYICCSESYAQLVGMETAREVVGKTDYDIFEKRLADSFNGFDRRVLSYGETFMEYEEMLPSGGSDFHWFSTSKYPLRDVSGSTIGIYGVTRDITSQKENNFELNTLLNTIPSGVIKYSADPGESFSYVSRHFIEALGYSGEQFREKFHNSFSEMVYEADRERVENEILVQESGGGIGRFEYRIETADGSLRWFHDEGIKISDQEGRPWYYVILIDVTDRKHTEQQLRTSEEEYRVAMEQSNAFLARYNVADRTLTLSPSTMEKFGLPRMMYDVPESRIRSGEIAPDAVENYAEFYARIVQGEKTGVVRFQRRIVERWRWVEARFTTMFSEEGEPVSAIITFRDVTEESEREAVYNKWIQSLEDRPPESYTLIRTNLNKDMPYDDVEGLLLSDYLSELQTSFNEQTRYFAKHNVVAEDQKKFTALVDSDTMLASYYRGIRYDRLEFRQMLPNGETRWLSCTVEMVQGPNSNDIMAYILFQDIDKEKRQELDTIQRADTDPLTGILNREAFVERVNRCLEECDSGEKNALFMMDIDGFKKINDTLGHSEGDRVLIRLADTVAAMVRTEDLVARLGGDEFVVFLKNIGDKQPARDKAEAVCRSVYRTLSNGLPVSLSIGIAISPENGSSFDELYRRADSALYKVKQRGRNSFAFYEKDESAAAAR